MNFTPRKHQTEGVQALVAYEGRFSVAEVAMAGGKSLMLGMLATHYTTRGRVLIVAHNKDLVRQNADACKTARINPGICSSSISKNAFARVTVGTIGTIINLVHLFRDVVAILVDEVHRVPPAESSQYRKLFKALPHAKVHGLSGTVFRSDGTGSLEKTFGPVVFRYTFLDALRDGYVKPIVPVDCGEDEEIDVSGLKVRQVDGEKEFDMTEQASRAIKLVPSHARTIIDTMQKYGRRRAIVFCCNIEHVDATEKELRRLGANAVGVHSRSVSGLRDKATKAFREGHADILVSCDMFTTGFDVPDIDLVVWERATKSEIVYAQGTARGARLTPLAVNCLLLDFGGNVARHGALDVVAASPGRMLTCEMKDGGCDEKWETWQHGKTCPECKKLHRSAPKCKNCSEKFDPHYHGMHCPHCGASQASLKECAACGETYASFLHPICPFCQYDNSVVVSAGKDLKTRGVAAEAVSIRAIIEKEPWQPIVSPPVWNVDHWVLMTKYTPVVWRYATLPDVEMAYIKRTGNGRYVAAGLLDKNKQLYQA